MRVFEMNNIQIFLFVIQNNIDWNLIFIRIGRYPFSSSTIHDALGDNINQFECPLDNNNAIWWLYHNLNIFGNPDYIGICHYRRFFSNHNQALLRIKGDQFDNKLIMTPLQQLTIISQNKLDGIITPAWYEDFFKNPSNPRYGIISDYEYVWEGAYQQFQADNVGLNADDIRFAYQNMLNFAPTYLIPFIEKSFKNKLIHFLGIFTVSKEIFNLYYNVVIKSLLDTITKYDRNTLLNNCNCRVGGYISERISSCFFDALVMYGKKFAIAPIMEIYAEKKPIYRKQTSFEAGLKCDISGLRKKTTS